MPTPNDGPLLAPPSPPTLETVLWRSPNSTCPPEDLRVSAWTIAQDFDGRRRQASVVETAPQQQPTPPADAEAVGSPVTGEGQSHDSRRMDCEDELSPVDMLSPTVSTLDMKDNEEPINSRDAPVSHASPVPTMSSPAHPEFSNVRVRLMHSNGYEQACADLPPPSSCLIIHLSSAQGAGSEGLSSLKGRYMRYRLSSNMSTSTSPFSAATYVFKVGIHASISYFARRD